MDIYQLHPEWREQIRSEMRRLGLPLCLLEEAGSELISRDGPLFQRPVMSRNKEEGLEQIGEVLSLFRRIGKAWGVSQYYDRQQQGRSDGQAGGKPMGEESTENEEEWRKTALPLTPQEEAAAKVVAEMVATMLSEDGEVRRFREVVTEGLLTQEEAKQFLRSPVCRFLTFSEMKELGIHPRRHTARVVSRTEGSEVALSPGEYKLAGTLVDYGPDVQPGSRAWHHRLVMEVEPPGRLVEKAFVETGGVESRFSAYVDVDPGLPISLDADDPGTMAELSLVGYVSELAGELVKRYNYAHAEWMARFILTGEAPPVSPFRYRISNSPLLTRDGRLYCGEMEEIRLTVPPWLSDESLMRLYRFCQNRLREKSRITSDSLTGAEAAPPGTLRELNLLRGERSVNRLPDADTLELAAFVLRGRRAGSGPRQKWAMRERWNRQRSGGHKLALSPFRKAYQRALLSLGLHPEPKNTLPDGVSRLKRPQGQDADASILHHTSGSTRQFSIRSGTLTVISGSRSG